MAGSHPRATFGAPMTPKGHHAPLVLGGFRMDSKPDPVAGCPCMGGQKVSRLTSE